jgi:Peptidase family S41
MRTLLLSAALLAACLTTGTAAAADGLANPDLEQGELGQVPVGWFFPPFSANAGYSAKLTDDQPKSGKRCAVLSKDRDAGPAGFGNLMQGFDATPYRGRRVRFKAAVRVEGAGPLGRGQLWLRVDRADGQTGFFDNMSDRPITSREWRDYEIVGDVADDASHVNVGLMLLGGGKAWLDAASFEILGKAGEGNEPPRPLEGRALDNLVAITRLLGYVRYFHPSDQAAKADWGNVALAGVAAAEKAKDAAELAAALDKLFRPLAPTVQIFPTGAKPLAVPQTQGPRLLAWKHLGVGTGEKMSIYSSKRINLKEGNAVPDGVPPPNPDEPCTADLGGGVSCRVPLAVYADDQGTLPRVTAPPPVSGKPAGFRPSGDDRTTRLADVVLAWNVFQHFYPYFDIVQTDWPAALRSALTTAATDRDGQAFGDTLRRLVAAVHDGHGNVLPGRAMGAGPVPFTWDWVEGKLVVTQVAKDGTGGLKRGDVVVSVNGQPAGKALEAQEQFISGATPQWRRYVGLRQLAVLPANATLTLDVQSAGGEQRHVVIKPTAQQEPVAEPRPEKIAELKPDTLYVDLDRITDQDFQRALPRLEKAKGIIFDLRGYPSQVSPRPLAHLIEEPITCARWNVPVVFYPDRKHMTFQFSNWKVAPQAPRLLAKVAFVTDGRAISYAETYLGMVEHYKLADIVGGPTAGTNGNINPFSLPGGYRLVWTGMKVLKHDGSQHHGVGIRPTVPAARTVKGVGEGRDELLERAVEVVSR